MDNDRSTCGYAYFFSSRSVKHILISFTLHIHQHFHEFKTPPEISSLSDSRNRKRLTPKLASPMTQMCKAKLTMNAMFIPLVPFQRSDFIYIINKTIGNINDDWSNSYDKRQMFYVYCNFICLQK